MALDGTFPLSISPASGHLRHFQKCLFIYSSSQFVVIIRISCVLHSSFLLMSQAVLSSEHFLNIVLRENLSCWQKNEILLLKHSFICIANQQLRACLLENNIERHGNPTSFRMRLFFHKIHESEPEAQLCATLMFSLLPQTC